MDNLPGQVNPRQTETGEMNSPKISRVPSNGVPLNSATAPTMAKVSSRGEFLNLRYFPGQTSPVQNSVPVVLTLVVYQKFP